MARPSSSSARALIGRVLLQAPPPRLPHHASQPLLRRPTAAAATAAAPRCLGLAPSSRRLYSAATAQTPAASAGAGGAREAAGAGGASSQGPPVMAQDVGRLVKIMTNSKLAGREDVKGALTIALEAAGLGGGAATGPVVRQLDQILFKGVYPSNMWLVEVGTREAAQRLTRQGQVQAPCGNLRVEEIREEDLARLQLASALGLDACAVHMQGVPATMGVDEVAYFFRDFRVLPDGIRPLPPPSDGAALPDPHDHRQRGRWHYQQQRQQKAAFIVKFDSADEAQRAIREKQAEAWGQGKVHIVSYK